VHCLWSTFSCNIQKWTFQMHYTIVEILFESITWLLVISKLHNFICVIRHTCLICNKLMLMLSYLWLNCHFSIQKAIHIPCMDVWCYVDMFCYAKCSQWRLNKDIKGDLKTLKCNIYKVELYIFFSCVQLICVDQTTDHFLQSYLFHLR